MTYRIKRTSSLCTLIATLPSGDVVVRLHTGGALVLSPQAITLDTKEQA